MSVTLDLNAQIIPGHSAGGFTFGSLLENIDRSCLARMTNRTETFGLIKISSGWEVYSSQEVYLRFTHGQLTVIGVMGGYRGTIPQGLGIGPKAADFEYVFGNITEGSEDELTFERVSGQLWFEVDEAGLNSDNWKTQVPLRQVKALYVM